MMMNKYRVHEVAKDFDKPSKSVIDLLGEYFEEPKKHMTALEEKELDVIFETFTQQNEVESFDAYFAMGKPAASWFFPDLKTLNPYRGKVHNLTVQGKPRKVIVTYHPSYLLRSPQEKRKAWLDWCLILDTLS